MIPEPLSFNGDDDRDLNAGPRTPAQVFWRAFHFALREGGISAAAKWVESQRRWRFLSDLVAEADRRIAELRGGAA